MVLNPSKQRLKSLYFKASGYDWMTEECIQLAGGLLMGPIAADYLHQPSNSTGSFAVVNDASTVCSGTCSFAFNKTLNPTLTSAAVIQTQLSQSIVHLRGSQLLPTDAKTPVSDIIVYVYRGTDLGNTSTAASVWMEESCTVFNALNDSITCTLPIIPAGVHYVQGIVPGRGSTNMTTLTVNFQVTAITPNTVSSHLVAVIGRNDGEMNVLVVKSMVD